MTERLTAGSAAPEFTLPAHDNGTFSLAEQRGKHVIVYFYPAAMTPGCTTQACDFRDNVARLTEQDCVVVGISPDTTEKLVKFAERDSLPFQLLSDPDKKVHEAYAAWGEKSMYGKKTVGVIRSTFIIGPDGDIQEAMYNVRAKGHVDRVLKALDALQA